MKAKRSPANQSASHLILACLMATALSTFVGCGNGMATVSGQVTLNGEPLAGGNDIRGTVYFFPEGGTGAPAVGLLDEDGRYRIQTGSQRGVQPGAYLVTISASQLIGTRVEGVPPAGRVITPRKYADPSKSGFRVDVASGSNEFDFEMVGEPPRSRKR